MATATKEVEVDLTDAQHQARDFVRAIEEISEAARAMLDAGLTREAIVLLVRHKANVRKHEVENVLHVLPLLADYYLSKEE